MGTGPLAVAGVAEAVPERRLVTVLFADLAGYTALCARLDPEDVHDVVRPAMRALRAVAESYGATVPGIQGDGFMAVFGAPVGHEDDAERAVRAAFALHQALERINSTGRALQVPDLHIGIDSGEVAVWCGSELDVSIAGDAVNRSARLCAVAAPREICVGPRTVELTAGRVDYDGPVPTAVRGIAEPVEVFRAAAIRDDAVPGRRTMSVRTPFVGRAAALRHLDVALERVRATGSGEVVVVLGEAGNGKSRLAHEWSGSSSDVAVVGLACSPYDDDPMAPWSALAPGIAADPDEGAGDDQHGALVHALHEHLMTIAGERPTVVVLDDLHWASDDAIAVLDRLAASPPAAPVLMVGLARPDGWRGAAPTYPLAPLDDEEMSALLAATVGSVLARDVTDALKHRSGGNPLFLEECLNLLVESGAVGADGSDAAEAVERIPSSMRQFITARLDALPPAERQLLQEAAVAGDAVWDTWLRALDPGRDVDAVLATLEARGLLRALSTSAVAGSRELAFKHALIREVAYESVSRRVRAARHEALAGWLASQQAAVPASVLAHHYASAWELAVADAVASGPPHCALATAAVHHLQRHADALATAHPRRAESVLGRALAIADQAPQCFPASTAADVALSRAAVRVDLQSLDGALDDLARVEPVVAAPDDLARRGRARLVRAQVLSTRSQVDDARPLFDEAVELLREAGDERAVAHALRHRAYASRLADRREFLDGLRQAHDALVAVGDTAGQRDVAIELAYEHTLEGGPSYRKWHAAALEATDLERDVRARAALRRTEAFMAQHRGENRAAVDLARSAYDDAVAVGATRVLVDALICRLAATAALGEVDDNERAYDEALSLASRLGLRRLAAMAATFSARARLLARDLAAAEERLRLARDTFADMGVREHDTDTADATVALDRGDWERVRVLGEATAESYERAAEGLYAVPLRIAVARARLGEDPARSVDALAEALDAARRHDTPQHGALAAGLLEQAQLLSGLPTSQRIGAAPEQASELAATARENAGIRAARRGDWSDAAAELAAAAQLWAGQGATVWLVRALVWQSEALRRAGEPEPGDLSAAVGGLLADLRSPEGLGPSFRAQLVPAGA